MEYPPVIIGCLFFGTIVYWLFRKFWAVAMPKQKKIGIPIFAGIIITSMILFSLLIFLVEVVGFHGH